MRRVHPTVSRLNAEWQEAGRAPVPPEWQAESALAAAFCVADVLDSVPADPDAVLGALLRAGDATAHRVVLQAMLGRAVLDAARDPSHDLDDYVAELWLRIATYPLARRPTRIAANLALDTRKRVRDRPGPRPVDPAGFATLAVAAETGPSVRLLLTRARRSAVIDVAAERALHLVYAEGLDSRQAAGVLGVSPAALRQRCHRALRRLAAHAADLGEAIA